MLLLQLLIQFLVLSLMFGAMVVTPFHAASHLQHAGQAVASAVSHNDALRQHSMDLTFMLLAHDVWRHRSSRLKLATGAP